MAYNIVNFILHEFSHFLVLFRCIFLQIERIRLNNYIFCQFIYEFFLKTQKIFFTFYLSVKEQIKQFKKKKYDETKTRHEKNRLGRNGANCHFNYRRNTNKKYYSKI